MVCSSSRRASCRQRRCRAILAARGSEPRTVERRAEARIECPRDRVRIDGAVSFSVCSASTVDTATQSPSEYADAIISNPPAWHVVILDKYVMDRAEGDLLRIHGTGENRTGIRRYDVYTTQLERVRYRSRPFDTCGIAIAPRSLPTASARGTDHSRRLSPKPHPERPPKPAEGFNSWFRARARKDGKRPFWHVNLQRSGGVLTVACATIAR